MRPDNLGDLVLFSGVLPVLRKAWPRAHIALCVRSFGRALFAHCPHIDQLPPYEPLRWAGRAPWPLWFSRANSGNGWLRKLYGLALPGLHYDLAILPMLSPFRKYHRVMQLISARRRAGITGRLDSQSAKEDAHYSAIYSIRLDATPIPSNQPELETHRLMLGALGIDASLSDIRPRLWTAPADAAAAEKLLAGLGQSRRLLGITPGAASPAGMKTLPAAWYVEVLRGINSGPLDVVLLGSRQDAPLCHEVEEALREAGAGPRVVDLAGATTVLELAEVIRQCDAMLCIDAAPMHIAVALGKPVAGVIGGGHFGRFYPWGDPALARVVNKPMDCYGCGWACKYDTVRCVREIPPELAAREIDGLLAAGRPR